MGGRTGTAESGPATTAPRPAGRLARRHPLTARLLTEWQVLRLSGPRGAPEVSVCRHLATPGSLAVDVGASVGNFTWAMARAVGPRGRVLALEASPAVYEELRRSTWSARVTAVNLAASDEPGWAELTTPVDGDHLCDQLGTIERRDVGPARSQPVRRIPLDDLIGADRPVSLIKIDVEGHERDVLAGARSTVDRWRPALVVEIEKRHLAGHSVAEVAGGLLDAGYVCWGLRGRSLLPWARFDVERDQTQWLAAAPTPGATRITAPDRYVNNFVFLPAERAGECGELSRRLGPRPGRR